MRSLFAKRSLSIVLVASALMIMPSVGFAQLTDEKDMWGKEISSKYLKSRKPATERMTKAVKEISDSFGVPMWRIFELHAAGDWNDDGAVAVYNKANNHRIIFYGSAFEEKFYAGVKNWDAYVMLAHEIGHHLAGHTLEHTARIEMELQADRFAGCVVAMLKGSLTDATGVFARLAPVKAAGTHPGRAERIAKVTEGWKVGSGSTNRDRCLK
jgi:hypothetical protein